MTDAPPSSEQADSIQLRAPGWRWPGSASTPGGPTSPAHYALINGVYLVALTGVAVLIRARERSGDEPVSLGEMPVLGAAAFALADVAAKQKVMTWLREPFVEESAEGRPVRPEGSGLRYAVGELLTCTRCVGAWCALGLVGLRAAAPSAGRGVGVALATVGANHFLQGGFALLCEKTNKVAAEANALRAHAGH